MKDRFLIIENHDIVMIVTIYDSLIIKKYQIINNIRSIEYIFIDTF